MLLLAVVLALKALLPTPVLKFPDVLFSKTPAPIPEFCAPEVFSVSVLVPIATLF